jgi:hypothetical protein
MHGGDPLLEPPIAGRACICCLFLFLGCGAMYICTAVIPYLGFGLVSGGYIYPYIYIYI